MQTSSLRHFATRTRLARTLAALAVALLAAAPLLRAAPAGNALQVGIENFAYAAKDITVTPGTTIVWTNKDETPHTVTSPDRSFASKGMDTGDTFRHTFDQEGDFAYLCTVHPYMRGTVHVRH